MAAIGIELEVASERLLCAADLAALPDELPSGPVRWELWDGRLVVMAPPGDVHARVVPRIGHYLLTQGEFRGHGEVRGGEGGVILGRDPDRLVGVDAAFIVSDRLPVRRSPEGYLETIPDIMVEVRSPNDWRPSLATRSADFLAAGCRLVWVIDPFRRAVTVYRPNEPAAVLTEADTLTAGDVIPGFAVPVRDLLAT